MSKIIQKRTVQGNNNLDAIQIEESEGFIDSIDRDWLDDSLSGDIKELYLDIGSLKHFLGKFDKCALRKTKSIKKVIL